MSHLAKWLAVIAGLLVCAIVLLVLNLGVSVGASGLPRMMRMMPMMGGGPPESVSNGERIFKTGTNARGEAIFNSMMSGMGGCVMCHGADGHGGQMMGRAELCNGF